VNYNNNFVFSKEINLKDLENYLNSISSLNSKIVQRDQNGNEILGSIKLKKPGKLRIEYYNNKTDHLIIGSNGIIAIIDYNSNSEPLRFPIKGTPLRFLSENNINLNDIKIVSKLNKNKNFIRLEIREKKPTIGLGKIILNFQTDPIKIVGWEIPISETETTEIELGQTIINQNLNDDLFYIAAEIMKYKNSKN
tara:strand:+ start:377 stop:958 length:582 start_codon:yes stop_codon:yes gene_type:complete